jgi:hypothetical protein
MSDSGFKRLHDAVAVLERRAVEDWRREKHPSLTLEEALAVSCKVMETTITTRPGGSTSVTFSIIARQLSDCDMQYFSLQRRGNRWYEQVLVPERSGLELPITKEQ